MSGKHSAVMFIFVMAIGLAAYQAEDGHDALSASTGTGRRPSALSVARPFAVGGFKTGKRPDLDKAVDGPRVHKHTEKLSGPLSTSIELVGAAPAAAGDTFALKGVIVGASPIENVEFKWILPEGVELVNGQASGTIASVSSDKPLEVQLTLRQLSDSNQQVHLQVLAASGAQKFGHTSQYNTMMEDLLKSSQKELLKSTEDYEANHNQKIMH
jgi:hypothetical protein